MRQRIAVLYIQQLQDKLEMDRAVRGKEGAMRNISGTEYSGDAILISTASSKECGTIPSMARIARIVAPGFSYDITQREIGGVKRSLSDLDGQFNRLQHARSRATYDRSTCARSE
jgi:hypothetical protein